MPVEIERWQRIERLYHQALAQEPSRRTEFIARTCSGDPSLEQELLSLLADVSASGAFLSSPALQHAAHVLASETTTSHPATIGRYRILRLLGEGGMGVVYEAEQEDPRRTVALKVIRTGLATPERLRRFRHESQALGRLQHPGIAQIYEASAADAGFGMQPYFAMELIRGLALAHYAEAQQLNPRQRLALMAKICDAVDHAHQRGLIHRDLKPGNILVDESGQPKILDFGVARVTENEAHPTMHTEVGQIIGTLAYMSPEQVTGDSQEVDARSDVYSLGVILYELLSGQLPYDVNHRQLHEAVQVIREEDPRALSSISRVYRGDIEIIAAKALEKDKSRRYASAADLAADIHRYLSNEPILARPASASYQLQKFARRHRALVVSVAAVFVVLLAGIAVSTWQAVRAGHAERAALRDRDRAVQAEARTRMERDRATLAEQAATQQRDLALKARQAADQQRNRALVEERRADEQAATATAISHFLQTDLLRQAGARGQLRVKAKLDPDLKVRTALDRAASGIAGKFQKQPLVEASIRDTIGSTYLDLGVYPQAQSQFEREYKLRYQVLGAEHPDTLLSLRNLAELYADEDKFELAQSNYRKVLDAQTRVLGPQHSETIQTMLELGAALFFDQKDQQAEPLLTTVLEVRRKTLGEEAPDTLLAKVRLAEIRRRQRRFAEAESLLSSTYDAQRRILGEEHPDTLLTMGNLSGVYWEQNKYAQAEPLMLKALEVQRRELGEENRETLYSMNSLAFLYDAEGKYAQAESLYARALDIERRTLGEEHRDTLITMQNLGSVYSAEGKFPETEALATRTLEIRRRLLGEESADTLSSMNNLANVYYNEEKFEQAEPIYAKVLQVRIRLLGKEHIQTLHSMNNLASLYQIRGRYADAEQLETEVLETRKRLLGPDDPETLVSMNELGLVYRCLGKYAQSEELLRATLAGRRRVLGDDHSDTLGVAMDLAVLQQLQGRLGEADQIAAPALEGLRRTLGPAHPDTLEATDILGEIRLQQGQASAAGQLFREALNNYEKTASNSWRRYRVESMLGASLAAQRQYAEAESLLVDGYQGMIERKASTPVRDLGVVDIIGGRIIQLYENWPKPEKAAEWKERLHIQ